ncbi:magnesium transporter CorA family protein [Wohlfahrtiimonas larvae]|uniref:Magnesium transporter CorA family protein n=2 Tax=Wohlfahrtiimonas larvae TaxID=1157986 RepID=A0ABP9MH04_9GAMM
MMTIYSRNIGQEMAKVDALTQNNWIEMVAPSVDEIAQLTQELSLPAYFLEEATDKNVRPKIESEGANQLFIIHLPYSDPNVAHSGLDIKYRTIPFAIILTGTHFITVCQEKTPFTAQYFMEQNLNFGAAYHTQNTLNILNQTADDYIVLTQKIENEITAAEDELSRSYRNPELYTLLYLNESLLYMATSLKQMLYTMRKIEQDGILEMHRDDREIYIDALVELEQAYAVTEINQLNSNNVMDAYGNIIQNNVSHVVKLLTAVTIVLSIPTMIASIYGMNVPLPYQDEPEAFSILIGVMVVMSVVVALIFRKKNYF